MITTIKNGNQVFFLRIVTNYSIRIQHRVTAVNEQLIFISLKLISTQMQIKYKPTYVIISKNHKKAKVCIGVINKSIKNNVLLS